VFFDKFLLSCPFISSEKPWPDFPPPGVRVDKLRHARTSFFSSFFCGTPASPSLFLYLFKPKIPAVFFPFAVFRRLTLGSWSLLLSSIAHMALAIPFPPLIALPRVSIKECPFSLGKPSLAGLPPLDRQVMFSTLRPIIDETEVLHATP